MNEQHLLLALSRLRGCSQAQALEAYQKFGSAQAVFESGKDAPEKLQAALKNAPEAFNWAEQQAEYCQSKSIRILGFDDADYPERLRNCADAPLLLFYRGTAQLNAPHILSVVGTRHITEYGKDLCRHLLQDLARLLPDTLIVSGLAYGVDIHAHRNALEYKLPTIGVLAHGLDRIYPASHRDTAIRMLEAGGLLTEYPSNTKPDKGNFVRRNRIVAGIADATIVVESAAKGGALITAHLAQNYNRDVFAYPGRIGDLYSEGCNRIIAQQTAQLVTSAEDITLALQWTQPKTLQPIQRELFPELSPEEECICKSLADGRPHTISNLVTATALPFNKVNTLLLSMELRGIIKVLPGGMYRLLK